MIKTKLKQKEQRREHRIEFEEEQSARVVMLLQEEDSWRGTRSRSSMGRSRGLRTTRSLSQIAPTSTLPSLFLLTQSPTQGMVVICSLVEWRRAVAPHGEHVRCGPE